MKNKIKIIDLFAGPGGLGEGFSAYTPDGEHFPYKIVVSIEKEASAHATLTLRAFYRQFERGAAPTQYYDFLRGQFGKDPEELYKLFPIEAGKAKKEARCLTLGEQNAEIYAAIDDEISKGELCVVIGGPPCQAYSLVGRARRSGESEYNAEKDSRNFLYKEYLKILARYKPIVFVMENVKGMLSAEVGGGSIFKQVLADLKNPCVSEGMGKGPNYQIFSLVVPHEDKLDPTDFVIRAEQYGIPQARHRVILIGVQKDYVKKITKQFMLEKSMPPTLEQLIGDLPKLRSGISKGKDDGDVWTKTVISSGKNLIKEISKISYQDIEKKLLINYIKTAIVEVQTIEDSRGSTYSNFPLTKNRYKSMPRKMACWFRDPKGNQLVCNHETRGHIVEDLARYLFASSWAGAAQEGGWSRPFPKPDDYPESLWPKHKNFHSGVFSDRFRVQIKYRYATTVTSHISKDGHYFIHYDASQCRSLTVREAARIQTFPDNYFFLGNRTQQYVQVGNAVPPMLAEKIASSVASILGID